MSTQQTKLDASHLGISRRQIRGTWAVNGDPIEGGYYFVTVHFNEELVKRTVEKLNRRRIFQ